MNIFKALAFLILSCLSTNAQTQTMTNTIFDFTVTDINGEAFALSQLKGKKVLIVNTASACGLTPQYEGLQKLHETYKAQNLMIIGFPANNFMAQEPGTDKEIATFCQKNYGVSFPMMSKIDVTGDNQHPLYQFLTQEKLNGHSDNEVAWNFQKYLINESGALEQVISPKTEPMSEEIINWITK